MFVLFSQGNAVQQGKACTRREPRGTFAQFQCHKSSDRDRLQVNRSISTTHITTPAFHLQSELN